MHLKVFFSLFLIALLSNCVKEPILIPDNTPYDNKYISTIQVENYVNKLFIDLIGREPLNVEMDKEVETLKDAKLDTSARIDLISKLQNSTAFLEGDSSYQKAYYNRFYDIVKIKMLEGVEDDIIAEERGNYVNSYNAAVSSGDSADAAKHLKNITEIDDIFDIPKKYRSKEIGIDDIFVRLMDNYIYDIINMNTFNFVNATFDDLYYRLPTSQEYDIAYEMIENNQSGYLVGLTGTNKGEYLNLLVNSREFYEGLIIWTYKSLLIRNPTAFETVEHLSKLKETKDFQELQRNIMVTDEFAGF